MPHTDRATVVAQYMLSQLNTNKVSLGVTQVLYGDQTELPGGITVVVSAGRKTRDLQRVAHPGAGTRNYMIIMVTVYNNTVGDEATKSLQTDQIAEAVEHFLHQDTTMGGRVLHGFVETWDPGFRYRPGSMFRATQMTWVGNTKTNLTDIP